MNLWYFGTNWWAYRQWKIGVSYGNCNLGKDAVIGNTCMLHSDALDVLKNDSICGKIIHLRVKYSCRYEYNSKGDWTKAAHCDTLTLILSLVLSG